MPNPQSELRIFISSTFEDMQEEREYLVKHIFPEFRAICRERGVEFTEIDLRWGITAEEAELGHTIKTCLDEIDKCRPYFIGILGSRYGWQPGFSDIAKDRELLERFPWVEDAVGNGTSVTEMEMSYGALQNPHAAPHAFFYFRKPGKLVDLRVEELRRRIRRSSFPVLEDFDSVETLGESVHADLLRTLDERFPVESKPSPLQVERRAHDAYAHTRRRAYVPDPSYIKRLNEYAANDVPDRKPLVIYGKSGSGKSSLLAYWTSQFRSSHPEVFLITHYVGASHTTPAELIRHIMMEIKERSGSQDSIPKLAEELERDLPNWLAKIQHEKIVIVLDSVNQLEDERGNGLNWLPSFIPRNISLILSTTDDAYRPANANLPSLSSRNWDELMIHPLDETHRREVITHFLSQYHKTLSPHQLELVAANANCSSPLFLRTVLEELRIFGKFDELDARIKYFLDSANTNDLFQRVLARMESDYGPAFSDMMSLVYCSRGGVSESELLSLLALSDTPSSRYDLSHILHALDFHLIRKEGLLSFFHNYLRSAVETRYVRDEGKKKDLHRRLAEYFHGTAISNRRADEEPYEWQCAEMWDEFRRCLCDIPMLEVLLDESRRNELMKYWAEMKKHFDLGDIYHSAIGAFERHNADDKYLSQLCTDLGDALVEASSYQEAEQLLRRSLELSKKVYGEADLKTAECMHSLATLYYYTANFSESERLFRESLACKVFVLGENDPSIAKTMNDLGAILYVQGKIDEAEVVWRELLQSYEELSTPDDDSVASVLNNLGIILRSKGSGNTAIEYFTRARALIEKSYGSRSIANINIISNLAITYEELENWDYADKLYKLALEISESTFGIYHENVALHFSNLAIFYSKSKQFSEAINMHKKALEIKLRVLGETHYQTLSSQINLALTYITAGDITLGASIYNKFYPMLKNLLGPDHQLVIAARKRFEEIHDPGV